MRKFLNPSFAVALAALVVAMAGTALAAGEITGSDTPETADVQRLGGVRIYVQTTRLLTFGDTRSRGS
jgi:hypothetical protein